MFYLMSPEVLKHEPYTQKSDIYSFGILMTEISTGLSPFHDYKKEDLAVSILNGFRPGFAENTPSFYIQLAKRCMDFNPEKRPTAKEAKDIVEFWYLAFSNSNVIDEFVLTKVPNSSVPVNSNNGNYYLLLNNIIFNTI